MSAPWSPAFAATVLRGMSSAALARATPSTFQTWPAAHPLPAATGAKLIEAERAQRACKGLAS